MKNKFWFVTSLALSLFVVEARPGLAQMPVRPQVPDENASTTEIKRQIAQLVARRNVLLTQFTPNSPEVRAIEQEIRELRRELQRWPRAPRPNYWRPQVRLLSSS